MRGYVLLGEPRCGSNWITSLANNTQLMGYAVEILSSKFLPDIVDSSPTEDIYQEILRNSKTPNDRFGIKIFSSQLYGFNREIGYDFLRKLSQEEKVKVLLLDRRDRIGQAISLARAKMTGKFLSDAAPTGYEKYDFVAISKSFYALERGYAFWRSYLGVSDIQYEEIFYEDALENNGKILADIADFLEVELQASLTTFQRIQRDEISEEWRKRFMEELKFRTTLSQAIPYKVPSRTVKNLLKFLRKERIKPYNL